MVAAGTQPAANRFFGRAKAVSGSPPVSAQGLPISANSMLGPSMGEWLLPRRGSMIVARYEVPGKASLERTVP
jgi:hypothetical protein